MPERSHIARATIPRPLPIPAETNLPVPRIAQHLRYCSYAWPHSSVEVRPAFSELVVEGWCHSTQHADSAICSRWKGKVHEVQLWFDHTGPSWEPAYSVCDVTNRTSCYSTSGRSVLASHYEKVAQLKYQWPQLATHLVKQINAAASRWPSPDPKYTAWQTAEDTGTKW